MITLCLSEAELTDIAEVLRLTHQPLVTFHYTPTHASWVNLAECFFSIVSKQALEPAVHRSGNELETALKEFVDQYNKQAGPFVWTKGPEKLQKIIELTEEFQQKIAG